MNDIRTKQRDNFKQINELKQQNQYLGEGLKETNNKL